MEGWEVGILFTLMWHSILFSPSEHMFCFGPISSYFNKITSKPMKKKFCLTVMSESDSCTFLSGGFGMLWEDERLRNSLFSNCWVAYGSCWLEYCLCCEEHAFPFRWCRSDVEWGNIYFTSNASVKRYDKTLDDVLCLLILMDQECVHFFHCVWVIFK